jgi:hypothetical protein
MDIVESYRQLLRFAGPVMFLKKVEEKEMDRMEKITRGASLNKFKPGVCQLWPRKKAAGQDLRNLEHA